MFVGKIYGSNTYILIFKNNIAMVSLSISLLIVYFTFPLTRSVLLNVAVETASHG